MVPLFFIFMGVSVEVKGDMMVGLCYAVRIVGTRLRFFLYPIIVIGFRARPSFLPQLPNDQSFCFPHV